MKNCMTSLKNSKIAGGKKIKTNSSTHNRPKRKKLSNKKQGKKTKNIANEQEEIHYKHKEKINQQKEKIYKLKEKEDYQKKFLSNQKEI